MIHLVFFILLLLSSCAKKISESDGLIVDIASLRWHENDFPIPLKISDSFDNQSKSLILDAMNEWDNAANINFFAPIQTTPNLNFTSIIDYYDKDKSVQGIYLGTIKMDEIGFNTLAATQVFYIRNRDNPYHPYNQIIHVDIILNGYYYEFSNDRIDETTYYLMRLVLHELGHVLGIGHTNVGIMYPYLSTDDKQETLTTSDIELVNSKYNGIPKTANQNTMVESISTPELQRIVLYLPASTISSGNLPITANDH